jgi:hypothetical protein
VKAFGIGALVAGSIAVVVGLLAATLLIGPILFWLAWNVLDFAHAVGLPELGFWGIVLATLFLGLGWAGKLVVTAIVFLVDPSWFHGAAQVHWPSPTFRNFVAIALLALIATRPRASRRWERRGRWRRRSRERGY